MMSGFLSLTVHSAPTMLHATNRSAKSPLRRRPPCVGQRRAFRCGWVEDGEVSRVNCHAMHRFSRQNLDRQRCRGLRETEISRPRMRPSRAPYRASSQPSTSPSAASPDVLSSLAACIAISVGRQLRERHLMTPMATPPLDGRVSSQHVWRLSCNTSRLCRFR
jgi:hypothetical protein